MGIFLKPQPKNSKSTKRGWPWLSLAWRVGAVVLVVGGLGLAWQQTETALRAYVADRVAAADGDVNVELINAPAWMSPALTRELKATVAAGQGPTAPAVLDDAVVRLNDHSWVRTVGGVRWGADGEIEVAAEYRRPIAIVEGSDGYHLVDREGVRLSGVYAAEQVRQLEMPLIVGVKARPAEAGRVWPGKDLAGGLALVQLLSGEPYLNQVAAVDVSRRDGRGRVQLALATYAGGLVRWGLPPGNEYSVEPPAAQKKKWLRGVYEKRGAIDAGGRVVDLFGPAIIHPRES
ncbi:MAG: hypothetical protein R3336_07635, partial [Phycisphaeraceae bacterium]|nr:hypothetical protein [Phycisphaeraceae bacterium]